MSMKKIAYLCAFFTLIPFAASALTFTRSLSLGSTGSDVTALQQFLNQKGYLSAQPTGYFGSLTEAAVQQYQSASGIVSAGTPETTGYGAVGPKTLASLNGGGATDKAALIAALVAEVKVLESQIAAILSSQSQGVAASTASSSVNAIIPTIQTPSTPASGGGGGSTASSGGGGGGGSVSSPVSTPAPAITMTSLSIGVGGSVIATANLNVRQNASPDATSLGTVQSGTFGTVIGGPTTASGHTWWHVSFAGGLSGWCIEDYLVPASSADSPALGAAPYTLRS